MVWCPTCGEDVEADYNEAGAMTACVNCGRVLEDAAFASDVTFMKGADGEGEMVGQFVGDDGTVRGLQRMAGGKVWSSRGDSHEVSLSKGRTELSSMIDHFVIRPAQDCLEAAHRLYRLAVEEGFTRGRVVAQVAACCLYIICRQESKPFMLIDLSDLLQVNVYKLGSVYLQLTKLLRLEDHPCLTRPIDPCLYIHRFAEKLLADAPQREVTEVINTAMRLIGQMKRDWMQTGRRPAGVCGAALWMSCHIHGHHKTKADVMGVVHVGWSTLDRRVREFAASGASALTPKEFEAVAAAAEEQTAALLAHVQSPRYLEAQQRLALPAPPAAEAAAGDKEPPAGTAAEDPAARASAADGAAGSSRALVVAPERPSVVCEHVSEGGARHAAMGLCLDCFKHFLATSGGIWGTAEDPPAFQKAEKKAAEAAETAAAAAASAGDEDEEGDGWVEREVGGLLVRMPAGHGSEEEIMAEMKAEQARQQQQQQQQGMAAVAAAGGLPEQQQQQGAGEEDEQQQLDAVGAVGHRRGRGRPPVGGRGRGRGRPRVSLTWRDSKGGRTTASTATGAAGGSSNGSGSAVSSPFDAFDAAAAAAEAAMAAAAGGRGRGRGVGRAPVRGKGRGRGAAAAAAAAGAGGGGVDAAELAADVAELDAALNQLHDAVLHPQQQQQRAAVAAAAAAAAPLPAAAQAAAAAAPVAEGGSEQFGSSLLGYGTACLKRPASTSQQQQQQLQQAGDEGPAAKRPRPASNSQQPTQCPGTPSQRSSRQQQQQRGQPADADVAAALAASAVDGLGLPPGAAAGLQQVMRLTPETGALVPVPVEGQEQGASGSNAAAAAAVAGDGNGSDEEGDDDGGSSSSSSSAGSDLGEVDEDEIEAYIRPRSAVKIQEMIWNGLHKDWIAAQEAKRAAAEAAAAADTTAAAVAAENRAAVEAREARDGVEGDEGADAAAAAARDEAAGRRQRAKPGPKKGSHNKKVQPLPEADNPAAAARLNVEAHRHLSEKINYRVLDDLFEETAGAFGGGGGGDSQQQAGSGDGGAAAAAAAAAGGAEVEAEAGPSNLSFRAARARQAEQRAAAETAAAALASRQLQEEARRRGAGGGAGGVLGGLGLPSAAAAAAGGSEGGGGGGAAAAAAKPGVGKGRLGSLSRPGSTRLGSLRR